MHHARQYNLEDVFKSIIEFYILDCTIQKKKNYIPDCAIQNTNFILQITQSRIQICT